METKLKNNAALSPKYKGVPTRYEETKPALVQGFTHVNILELGQNIHVKWENMAEYEKSKAVQVAEDAVWEQAEHIKKLAVEKAQDQGHKELQKRITDLNEEHAKAVKAEALRVEAEMKKIALEQVKQEREYAAKVLEETVTKVKAEKDQERIKAVEVARQEEVEIAAQEAKQVASETAEREAQTARKEARSKAVALEELTEKLTKERITAVLEAQAHERKIATNNIHKVMEAHAIEIANLHQEIHRWNLKNEATKEEVAQEQKEKEEWIEKYEHLKSSYQSFIDETSGFRKGQAEFLIGTL